MTQPVHRIAVLASGNGSNLQALIDAIGQQRLPVELAGVFSDRPRAGALRRAEADFATRTQFDEHLFTRIDRVQPDLIVCAGYMRLVSEREVSARLGRMINIHPSLLPAFKGLHTHQQALDAGVTEHGASVHFVSPELDGGPVISQVRVPVLAGDYAATLARRVLDREHPLLVQTLRLFAQGRITLAANSVRLDGRALAAPLQLGADDFSDTPSPQEFP
jgi:phosphoribosylglycinamide formyltransferase-1